MSQILGLGQISLVDLNDAVSGSMPVNPSVGTIWIDSSANPSLIKEWNGTAWNIIGEVLDEGTGAIIEDIEITLGNMANDNKIDFDERMVIKDKITEIIGYVPADGTSNLPASATLDSSARGKFYSIRKSALNAGISSSDSTYVNVATQYDNLKNYLNSLSPRPWDLSTANKDLYVDVTKSTFRDKFLQYYLAVDALAELTAEKLGDIQVGGRNLLLESGTTITTASYAIRDYYLSEPIAENEEVTISLKGSLGEDRTHFGLYNSGGNVFINKLYPSDEENGIFRKTFNWKVISSSNEFLQLYHMTSSSTSESTVEWVKLERGNIGTDWTSAPEDNDNRFENIETRVTSAESKITDSAIVNTVTSSEVFNIALDRDNDFTFEHGGENWSRAQDMKLDLNVPIINDGDYGGKSIQITNQDYVFYGKKIPINTDRIYKVKFRVKQTDDPTTAGKSKVYAGVASYDANGTKLTTSTYGTHRYCAVASQDITVADGWQTFTGTITGEGDESFNQFIAGTKYVVPMFIVNYSGGNGTALVDICSIEDVTDSELLAVEIDTVRQEITDDKIVSTVTQSITYQNDLNSRASADAIGDLATRDELNNLDGDVDDRIADAINGINFDDYVTQSELEQESTNITAKFKATGGMNLLKNSIGYADFDFWNTVSSSHIDPIKNQELDTLGFGSGFHFQGAIGSNWVKIIQDVPVVTGNPYTLSWYINKLNDDGYFWVGIEDANGVKTEIRYDTTFVTNGYMSDSFVYTPETSVVKIYAVGTGNVNSIVTGLMFSIGDVALQWSLATGETYNRNIRLDINGVRVSQLDANSKEIGYTQISPDEFAGYYDTDDNGSFEKVFYLNGDETVSKKVRALEEFTMGSIKIIKVEAGGHNGWAFVPVLPES